MDAKSGHIFKRAGSARWQLRVYVPADVQATYGRKEELRSLRTTDWATACGIAEVIIQDFRRQWDDIRAKRLSGKPDEIELLRLSRDVFDQASATLGKVRAEVHAGEGDYGSYRESQERRQVGLVREISGGNFSRWEDAAERVLHKRGFVVDRESDWFKDFAGMVAEATVTAIDVENRRDRGELAAKPSSDVLTRADAAIAAEAAGHKDMPFTKLVAAFMRQWKAGMGGKKETNTEAQKHATYRLFAGYWADKPIRGVMAEHAAEFRDKLKLLDPHWSRSPSARKLGWDELIAGFGDQAHGLSDATMNRHMAALQSLWKWASKRGHCTGDNPFDGFHVKLREGVNTSSYLPWEDAELRALLDPPPKRDDLLEVMIVAMYSGMRLDEIASLTWGRLRTEGEGQRASSYFDIEDAKTAAGVRQVPVHPALGWLLDRDRGAPGARIWPKFNPEGPGKKPGADAGRDFSSFKIARGFRDHRKVFHSFRKNVTRIMERAGVPENEWAQVFGHERGFTYRTYNPDGITLARKAEIISLIDYPGVSVPHPVQ